MLKLNFTLIGTLLFLVCLTSILGIDMEVHQQTKINKHASLPYDTPSVVITTPRQSFFEIVFSAH
jgi:hypothetical protein